MKIGQAVKVKIYEGESTLIVAGLNGDHVNLCTQEEYESARKDGRQPILVGFSVADVIR
jgi:hypothetical protein